jgi:hypothetical protein
MRGQQERTGPLFSYISTEDRIPASHPLRQVRRLADQALDRLNPTFCQLYPEAPSASKVDASPFRSPGGLMEQSNASLQRGRQG